MRLRNLEIQKLHGSLDKKVVFNDGVNLLVGINGSGKTSVLNVIEWLLRPNLVRLATTRFDRLKLAFDFEGKKLTIEAIQSGRDLDIQLYGTGVDFHPLNVKLRQDPSTISSTNELEELSAVYSQLGPDKKEVPIWEALKRIPNPIVLALDRTITAEAEDVLYSEQGELPRIATRYRPPRSPLSRVKEVAAFRYLSYRNKLGELNENLKAKMVMSAFLHYPSSKGSGKKSHPVSLSDVTKLELRISEYLSSAIKDSDISTKIKGYFSDAKAMIRQSQRRSGDDQDLFWGFFSSQYRQIVALAEAFDVFEKESRSAFQEVSNYLELVNNFLRDSGKEVLFDESTNQLRFRYQPPHAFSAQLKELDHMSSGERQILILFTFLAFVAQGEGIFIVDEPELSLHPKWQSEFLDAFLKIKPAKTELILATHSPDIVGKHKQSCVVLLPAG